MPMPTPPQLEAARAQMSAALQKVEGRAIDLDKTPWADLEKSLIKVLGGAFSIQKPEHQVVALGLAAVFAERLAAEMPAFWFPSRDTPEGAELGFAEALIKLSPFGAVVDALTAAKLSKLDDVLKEIRTSLAQAKFGSVAGQQMRLGAEDYMRLFDAGFVQVIALDKEKAGQTWNQTPERLSSEIRESLTRATKLPPELKKQLEQQLLTALARMEQGKPVIQSVAKAPRVVELVGMLTGLNASTGAAPEEFWLDMVMPLLFIGSPEKFPQLEGEELNVAKQGVDPLFLFLEVVPHQFKSEDEGMLGAFPADKLSLLDPAFQAQTSMRVVGVSPDSIKEPLKAFDPNKTRAAIKRFSDMVKEQVGANVPVKGAGEAAQMLDAALMLLSDLKKVVEMNKPIYVRRLTEAEAASEPALGMLRSAMQGPKIILTG